MSTISPAGANGFSLPCCWQVRAILAETGAPAEQLIFVVIEGLLIEDISQTITRMCELADLGICLPINDFGTGYSNLAYLKKMPLYELTIDKSFIQDTPHDCNVMGLVQSILAMAGHLGTGVVAEASNPKHIRASWQTMALTCKASYTIVRRYSGN